MFVIQDQINKLLNQLTNKPTKNKLMTFNSLAN